MGPHLLAIRFGTGLAPDRPPPADAGALLAELDGPDTAARAFPIPDWAARMTAIGAFRQARRARRRSDDPEAARAVFRRRRRDLNVQYQRDLAATLARAAVAPTGIRERLAWFWADHFAVSDGNGPLRRSVAAYHDAALRPHLAGRFADLLRAAVTHPAMLAYLDQGRSVGPGSPRGRARGEGLNENLAREVLELHTLGVGGPYGQDDVRELAELLTGLTMDRDGAARFDRDRAEPGAEVVLGRRYGGARPNRHDIGAVLDDLAAHPATARHVSRKLAVHFVADDPPPALVDAMAVAWTRTDGDLRAVYEVLFTHPAALSPDLAKVRRPLDLVAAAARATGLGAELPGVRVRVLRAFATDAMYAMGQAWLRPPGPQGWPEAAAAWITPQGLAARLDWALATGRVVDGDPRAMLDAALGPIASARTRFAVGAAEDRAAGRALVLAVPEFQRR
ncbi:MAG: DUF1800 domain-containing protein [Pseudomonadota bacterium]